LFYELELLELELLELELLELELLELDVELHEELHELESLEISISTSIFLSSIVSFICICGLSDIVFGLFCLYYYKIKKKYEIIVFLFKLIKVCKVL